MERTVGETVCSTFFIAKRIGFLLKKFYESIDTRLTLDYNVVASARRAALLRQSDNEEVGHDEILNA